MKCDLGALIQEAFFFLTADEREFIMTGTPPHVWEGEGLDEVGIDEFTGRKVIGVNPKYFRPAEVETLLGDLTFLHDISALSNSSKSNIRIFIIDNNGGGIFSTLPQSNTDNFEQVFGTPHNLDLVKVVNGFGLTAKKASNLVELNQLISEPIKGLSVVVVSVPSRIENAKNLKDIVQRVSKAVRIGINLA